MSAAHTRNEHLEGFQSLANGIAFYQPEFCIPHTSLIVIDERWGLVGPRNSTVPSTSPSLVILATWFGALPRHVSKYTDTYKTLFPGAAILVLPTSIPDMVYRPYSKQQKNLAPAILIVIEHARPPSHEILLHIFSTAGAHTACQLGHAYKSETGSGLEVGALILDSSPGINSYRSITDGFISGLPSTPIVKDLLSLVVYGLVGLIKLKESVTGEDHFIHKLRKDLNDEEFIRLRRGRVYIYCKEDKIVGFDDVESHARVAEGKDIGKVRMQLWDKSSHVGHMAVDGEKYWNVVRDLWEDKPTIKSRL